MKLLDNTKGFFQSKPGGVDDAGVRMPKQRSKASKLMDYVLPALVAMGGGAGLPFGLMAGRNISQGKKRQAEQDYMHRSKLAAERAAKRQKRADALKRFNYKKLQDLLDREGADKRFDYKKKQDLLGQEGADKRFDYKKKQDLLAQEGARKLLLHKQTQAELDRQLKRDLAARKINTKLPFKPLMSYLQFVKGKNEKSWFDKDPLNPKLQSDYIETYGDPNADYLTQDRLDRLLADPEEQEPVQPPVQPPESQLSNFSEKVLNIYIEDGTEDQKRAAQQELQRRGLGNQRNPLDKKAIFQQRVADTRNEMFGR